MRQIGATLTGLRGRLSPAASALYLRQMGTFRLIKSLRPTRFWPLMCCRYSEGEEAAGQVYPCSTGLSLQGAIAPALPLKP